MALSDTIATIIDRTKRIEICDTLHDAQNATTEDELIKAGLALVVYAYQAGIVDDALLASDFTEATLNANNIFTTGSFTLNDPFDEIFIMRNAVVTVNLAADLLLDSRCKISIMGEAILILFANDKSYATVKAYDNSDLNITINDDAMVDLETKDIVAATVTQNDNSVFHLLANGASSITHAGNDAAYGLAKLFQNAALTYTLSGAAALDVTTHNSSQVILT